MTALKKAVRTRRGVEPTGRPARREVERGRRARTNSSRTFAQVLLRGDGLVRTCVIERRTPVVCLEARRRERGGELGGGDRGHHGREGRALPSLLGPRSTRKVQPVQSSRASFLWLFSSVAMVLCAALAP